MSKSYLRDTNGRVRNCTSNIAQMNAWEYTVLMQPWRFIRDIIVEAAKEFVNVIRGVWVVLLIVVALIFFPITFFLRATFAIRRAKKEMAMFSLRVKRR